MNDSSFNEYYISSSKWRNYAGNQSKNKQVAKIVWLKTIILELRTLTKQMIKCEKAGNRKEIKSIIAENVENLHGIDAIREYFAAGIENEGKILISQILHDLPATFEFM